MDILKLSGGTIGFLKKALDLRSQRQNLVASNVANVDTPNYKSLDISFEEQMGKALESHKGIGMTRTNEKHIPAGKGNIESVKPKLIVDTSFGGIDGNNVNVDKQMAAMAKNSIIYNAVTQMIGKKFEGIKYSIDQGGK